MAWLRKLLHLPMRDEPTRAGSTNDELREAKELATEQTRHTAFIVRHVDRVSDRVRLDAVEAERRFVERRMHPR